VGGGGAARTVTSTVYTFRGGRRTLTTICSVDICVTDKDTSVICDAARTADREPPMSTPGLLQCARELRSSTSNAEPVMALYEPTALFRFNTSTSIVSVYTKH
jgi:hypothetical protein